MPLWLLELVQPIETWVLKLNDDPLFSKMLRAAAQGAGDAFAQYPVGSVLAASLDNLPACKAAVSAAQIACKQFAKKGAAAMPLYTGLLQEHVRVDLQPKPAVQASAAASNGGQPAGTSAPSTAASAARKSTSKGKSAAPGGQHNTTAARGNSTQAATNTNSVASAANEAPVAASVAPAAGAAAAAPEPLAASAERLAQTPAQPAAGQATAQPATPKQEAAAPQSTQQLSSKVSQLKIDRQTVEGGEAAGKGAGQASWWLPDAL